MPKAYKLRRLRQGKGVRPPRQWFNKMLRETKQTYPQFSRKRLGRIVGGIWSQMSRRSKVRVVKKYEVGK